MKYFSETGNTKEEVIKKIYSKYGQRVYLYKFITEEIPQIIEPSGLFKRFKKPKEIQKKIYRCYFGVPEREDDIQDKKEDKNEKTEEKSNNEKDKLESLREKSEKSFKNEDELKKELQEIKETIKLIIESNKNEQKDDKLTHQIKEYMIKNSFSLDFINNFLSNIAISFDTLDIFKLILKERMRLNINIKNGISGSEGNFFMMVGPTGVGKTTTLAKIAAIFYKNISKNIRFISFDSYRLGADLQMKKYAEVFNKPFNLISNENELKDLLKNIKDDEFVFIDTAGESITKDIKISEVKKFISLFPKKPIIFLNISASSKADDIKIIKDKFSVIGYDYYIITKIDETTSLGPILEVCYKDSKPIVYLTNGQSVPEDILIPDINKMLDSLKDI
ncbi:MAG TPA: hypothetical protein PKW55_07475 [Spirochaetota bacterium]|nr:hypothetical protein [Spirochaetota bacterium]HOM38579.1 hypothetical protein [Spirochaetota bacterium]HPQ49716.1 hypothetical protein [Spirochaetota bacterium]